MRGTGAQSVTQPDVHITVSEGAPLELRCNYSSSVQVYLFWYMQHPNQGLRLLLKYISGDILVKGTKGFEAEFRKSEKAFHLRKPAVQWSDAAKYFCASTLSLAKTTQPVFIESYEGQEVNIPCNHTKIATNEYIHWYRQFPNQGPQFVIQGYKTNVENEVVSLFISADRTSSTLSLPRAALRDTAVYYCTG
ncbi:immunoglobulin lambda-1 light chain [Prionailurus iriomotensis]